MLTPFSEVLKGEQYNEMADVYSYAIVLYELYTRQFPFHEYDYAKAK